jgi:uncharacterized protein
MITDEIARVARKSVLCWLATASADGRPNVSPKEVFAPFDREHLVIANIASPSSVRNIAANAQVCVSFIDVFVQKGFKLSGTARNITRGHAEYETWAPPLLAVTQGRFTIHSVIVVKVLAVEAILAPNYRFHPDEVTEESQVASAMRTYGVRPADEAGT